MVFGTWIDHRINVKQPNEQEMRARKTIKKWTEPLSYIVVVAAFGFLTSVVTHARSEDPVQQNDTSSFTLENDQEAMFLTVFDNKEVSL
jgi:hypothetical protein